MRGSALLLLLSGCGPSLDHLVATRNYSEALCKATVVDPSPQAELQVERGLARDIDPALSLHAVTAEQLRPVLGESAGSVSSRVLLLQVDVTHNHGEFGSLITQLQLVGSTGVLQPLDNEREAWAALTGERVPQPVVTGRGASDARILAHDIGELTAKFGELVTLGLIPFSNLVGDRPQSTRSVQHPSADDYWQASPQSEALYEANLSIWPRPSKSDVLRLRYAYTQFSYQGDCGFERVVTISLPGSGSLEERINRRFDGQRWIRFEDLDLSKQ